MGVDLFGQLPPAVAQALVARHQRFAVGATGHGGIEGLADGQGQQRLVLATAGVAWLTHGCPFLWLFWARLKRAGNTVAQIYVYVKVTSGLTVTDCRFTLT